MICVCTALCGGILADTVSAQTVVEPFEYANDDELIASWTPSGNAIISLTNAVPSTSTGKQAMSVTFNFASLAWATEFVKGPYLASPISIDPAHYLTLSIKGDPAFASADFRNFYLYAYDENGNFGRWGAPIPTTTNWQYFNFTASGIQKPWDSPELPDMSRIIRFAIFQYGSEVAIPAYSATITIDDIVVRDTPMTDPTVFAESTVESFEYPNVEALQAAWTGSANAKASISTAVSLSSSGQSAMKVQFDFPSTAWATEFIKGPELTNSVAIGPDQYVSLRIKGDTAFAASDFRNFYLYAYDNSGNFGRWGTQIPTNASWQILNFSAKTIEKPWDSPALPNLSKIVRFAIFQYGSEAAIPAYTASIEVDDISIRNTLLIDQVVTSETVVDSFEYATEDAMRAVYTGSANTVLALSSSVDPKSTGKKALSLTFNFPSAEWATESVKGAKLAKTVAIGPKQYVSIRIKGDPAFASADFQSFFIYAYDENGNFGRWGQKAPATADWEIFNFVAGTVQKPWDSAALPDLSKIVRFAFFQYGSQAALDPYTATIELDDFAIRNTPLSNVSAPSVLSWTRSGNSLTINASGVVAGTTYRLYSSTDLKQWNAGASVTATANGASWTVSTTKQMEFFRVAE